MQQRAHGGAALSEWPRAAERLDCNPALVYRLIERGELPALQLGGRGCSIRIDENKFEAWLCRQRKV